VVGNKWDITGTLPGGRLAAAVVFALIRRSDLADLAQMAPAKV
jgi:hypothetical protein